MPRTSARAVGPSGRALLAVGGGAALLVLVLAAVLHGQQGDTAVDLLLGTPVIELFVGHRVLVVVLAELGGPESIGPLALVAALGLGVRRRWGDAALVVLAPALAGGVTQYVLKPLVDRPLGGEPAFPSGHASGTWALAAAVVVLLLREVRTPRRDVLVAVVLALAVVNAVGLVGAQYHFVTDVIGGAAVGTAAACLVAVGAATTTARWSARR